MRTGDPKASIPVLAVRPPISICL